MMVIGDILGLPLGYIMYFCYALLGTYGAAILLFALITKIIFFPLSVSAQKNSNRLAAIQPKIDELKKLHAGDRERFYEEQDALFKREKYSPLKGMVPLLVQLALILGMVNVIYNPLKHLLHIPADAIGQLLGVTQRVLGAGQMYYGEQLLIVSAVRDPGNAEAFVGLSPTVQGLDGMLERISGVNLNFVGIDLGTTPTVADFSVLWLVPLIAGLSSLALCVLQVRLNPVQRNQKPFAKWGMSVFLVAFSVFFTFIVPSGVGVYWIASNLLGIVVALVLNRLYSPGKPAALEPMPG